MKLNHFKESEFRGWYDSINPELLVRLDVFRSLLGYGVKISPANGAIGRHAGESHSQHNIDRYGEVNAIDVMPEKVEPKRWLWAAEKAGFRGIGIYPHWKPSAGLHLDVRESARVSYWGAIRPNRDKKQQYVELAEAMEAFNQ